MSQPTDDDDLDLEHTCRRCGFDFLDCVCPTWRDWLLDHFEAAVVRIRAWLTR